MSLPIVLIAGPRNSDTLAFGMSLAFETLITGLVERDVPFIVLDRSPNMQGRRVGTFSMGGAAATLRFLFRFLHAVVRVDTVYLIIGISKPGFFRDAVVLWSSWLLRKRVVIHLHGGGLYKLYLQAPEWLQFAMRHTYARATVLIVLGALLCNEFSFVRHAEKKTCVVPNGLPPSMVSADVEPKALDLTRPLRLLYLSNMICEKGFMDVLAACAVLQTQTEIPFICDFCGAFVQTASSSHYPTDMNEAEFRRHIIERGLKDVVNYHGQVNGQQKRIFLQKSNLLILPTFYEWEGQPLSIIEALAFATPVVTTAHRGIPELIIDGYNGLLVDPHSPDQIADAVRHLWSKPELYQMYSQNALDHFQQYFTHTAHLDLLVNTILGTDTFSPH